MGLIRIMACFILFGAIEEGIPTREILNVLVLLILFLPRDN